MAALLRKQHVEHAVARAHIQDEGLDLPVQGTGEGPEVVETLRAAILGDALDLGQDVLQIMVSPVHRLSGAALSKVVQVLIP